MMTYETIETAGAPIKAWVHGVPLEPEARAQLINIAALPFIHDHVAVMPDVHLGKGATVGSVIPTRGAIVPAAVGVDIGCGMMAVQIEGLRAEQLPDTLSGVRSAIERVVPVGQGMHQHVPKPVENVWTSTLKRRYEDIEAKHPAIATKNSAAHQIGTLGGGNHFIELCLDEAGGVWVMLHSGSRGIGNRIGQHFIALARAEMERQAIRLPDRDLAWFAEGTPLFGDYVEAVGWAQDYAMANRRQMMKAILDALEDTLGRPMHAHTMAVNCHHNYVEREHHYGADVWVTRKGAVRARTGDLGIIPGSMGARSYIVRGRGNAESFCSCSHGAGRAMSRGEANRRFTVEDHVAATAGIECRKDTGVIDETPMAYKDIEAVMAAQADLVEIVHTLRQVVCVKG
jgi:tRNA-splicing ligase RtcB